MNNARKILLAISLLVIVVLLALGSERFGQLQFLSGPMVGPAPAGTTRVETEESATIDVVKKVTPAVVTVGITTTAPAVSSPNFDFGPFGNFFPQMMPQQPSQPIKQDIGSGFVIRSDGLIVTNKHVVSDTTAKYRVITSDNKTYDVTQIYRDPNNDLAILKIAANGLPTVELGDSDKLQVGQFALAIGTALGEFRSTVTTGVISGIGRFITAGAPDGFSGAGEQLSNILQTSAAINPGNSGGPLLNSAGQVIGVNVAVAQNAQNIGFALPINLVKQEINTFEANGGKFPAKAFLGVNYTMISQQLSILNDIPEGAYVQSVVSGSPADQAGVAQGDIITKIDNQNVRDAGGGLAAIISSKKPGDTVSLTIYRDSQTQTLKATLSEASQ
ncbi:MAG: trypsin-like peptidase domain-containing protein [Patescibacteria group bacterium]|nr:trypsin-like peptidase domain-containing protein [Patescibacteria group bacterium]MCL5432153.1 trypsin-like peptidase domain-containing protein [Patescibacteria group bacterium]